ncbi:MAG: hypothetical protein H0X51_00765 [Parachlamydiaceae bacterium]|nr:hypothetical protein [Parachlamydiaceae bacterium]
MLSAIRFNQDTCGICLDTYAPNASNDCLRLRCGHIFHHSCVNEWIEKQNSCPNCRAYSVILEPVIALLNRAGKNFLPACLKIVLFIVAPLFTITIASMALRTYNNLPLIHAPEEIAEQLRQANEHNLRLGYTFKQTSVLSMKSFFFYSLVVIPVILALSLVIYIFVTTYIKSRVMMTTDSAERINYVPPASDLVE